MERVLINNIGISLYGFIYWSVKRAYCSSLSDFGYKNESVVWKIGNTDLNFSIGIEPILKPLYLERR